MLLKYSRLPDGSGFMVLLPGRQFAGHTATAQYIEGVKQPVRLLKNCEYTQDCQMSVICVSLQHTSIFSIL